MYRELLGAYALDAVTRDEGLALSAHLEECDSCRAEVAVLRSVVATLPRSVEEMDPPASLRSSILAAIEQEPRSQSPLAVVPAASSPAPIINLAGRRSRRQWAPWAAVAALLLLSIGLFGWNLSLRDSDDPERQTIALLGTSPEITASAEATYLEDEGVIVLSLRDLPALADDQVYQVWLIDDAVPEPAGVFTSGQEEFAVAANPADYQQIAITAEPGPLGVEAPTTIPILAGEFGTA